MNERILLYYYETSGRLVFVRFLEEIEDTKKTFRNYKLTFRLSRNIYCKYLRSKYVGTSSNIGRHKTNGKGHMHSEGGIAH